MSSDGARLVPAGLAWCPGFREKDGGTARQEFPGLLGE